MATPPIPGLGGGAPPGAPAGPQLATILGALSSKTQTPGQDLSKQSADLQGADPSLVMRQLESVNQVLGVLFVKTFQTLPNVANQISATMKALSKALKEIQQASNVSEVVGKSEATTGPQPVQFGPANIGQNAQPDRGLPAT